MTKTAPRKPVSPLEARAAKTFLKSKKVDGVIAPKPFAAAAKELGNNIDTAGLMETLRYIARLQMGGQGLGPFPQTEDFMHDQSVAAGLAAGNTVATQAAT